MAIVFPSRRPRFLDVPALTPPLPPQHLQVGDKVDAVLSNLELLMELHLNASEEEVKKHGWLDVRNQSTQAVRPHETRRRVVFF